MPSPDGNGILLYLVFSTRCKRYSVQLEIAPNETNFDNPRQVQIKKNSNFTLWKHHLQNAYDHKN